MSNHNFVADQERQALIDAREAALYEVVDVGDGEEEGEKREKPFYSAAPCTSASLSHAVVGVSFGVKCCRSVFIFCSSIRPASPQKKRAGTLQSRYDMREQLPMGALCKKILTAKDKDASKEAIPKLAGQLSAAAGPTVELFNAAHLKEFLWQRFPVFNFSLCSRLAPSSPHQCCF